MDADKREYLAEMLAHSAERVTDAEEAVALAERSRRINATHAVRSGYGKTATAEDLKISRPTLDAWIARVETTPDELADVERLAQFEARADAKAAHRKGVNRG